METRINLKRNGSNVVPYVIVGSAIGGAIGYLLTSESGKKIRHRVTHPDELTNDLDGARNFVEHKARIVTHKVHDVIDRAKQGIEEGQRGYQEAGQYYREQARK